MTPKYFTIDEANRTLPFVSRIVTDIVEEYRRWRENLYKFELIAANQKAGKETDEQKRLRIAVDESTQRINEFIDELSVVGCVLKGFEEGLVDFRSKIKGRDVFLCWKLGESAVDHWHEVESGFAGRQPLEVESVAGESDA